MKDRIQQILREKALSSVKFAEILEVQPSSISHLLSGRNNPNFDFISKLLIRFPDINPDWLILGKGTMFRALANASLFPEKSISLPLLQEDREQSKIPTGLPLQQNKRIDRIIICYTDKTFDVYSDGNV